MFKLIANPGMFSSFGEDDGTKEYTEEWKNNLKKGILVTGGVSPSTLKGMFYY